MSRQWKWLIVFILLTPLAASLRDGGGIPSGTSTVIIWGVLNLAMIAALVTWAMRKPAQSEGNAPVRSQQR